MKTPKPSRSNLKASTPVGSSDVLGHKGFVVSMDEIITGYKAFLSPNEITRPTKAANSASSIPGRPNSFKIWCNCLMRVCPKDVKSICNGDGVTILLSIQPALPKRSIKRAKPSGVGVFCINVCLWPNDPSSATAPAAKVERKEDVR